MKRFFAALILFVGALLPAKEIPSPPSAEAGTLPPEQYILDYYAPPPDWLPIRAIGEYNLNTRIPDLTWMKYDGAYAPALRIRPMDKEQLEKDIEARLIDEKRKSAILEFSAEEEAKANNRVIVISKLNLPGDDFIEFSFKMKAKTKNANPAVKVNAHGVASITTSSAFLDADTRCVDGFHAYKVKFPARQGRVLQGFSIELPASAVSDPDEEYVFIDLNLKRNEAKPRFADPPQRQWIRKAAFFTENRPLTVKDGIPDIYAFVNSNPSGVESLSLPLKNFVLRPQTDKEKDGGFKTENVKVKLDGKEFDALRVVLTKGPRCYLKFPVEFDALKYNTMTFLAKIEVPDGMPPFRRFGETYSQIYGSDSFTINNFFDVFSFGVTSEKFDPMDWNRQGVSQGHSMHALQTSARAPAGGWRVIAHDLRYGDNVGNKSTTLSDITHWCFYYANAKIPEGKEVVVTIVNPKVSSGLMLAGGDMAKYKQFLDDAPKRKLTDFSDSTPYLGAPAANRLKEPLPFVRNHVPQGEIIVSSARWDYGNNSSYQVIPMRAVDYFCGLLKNKLGIVGRIPILDRPSKEENVKIFVGGSWYAAVNKTRFEADRKMLAGTTGFAIRADGKNIYIYGGENAYCGQARGAANGMYMFTENNTDEIMAYTYRPNEPPYSVFEFSKEGNLDLVWGDGYVNIPALSRAAVFNSNVIYLDRNCSIQEDPFSNCTKTYGGVRNLFTGHWLAHLGTGTVTRTVKDGVTMTKYQDWSKPNERWGRDEEGKPVKPDCYTRHSCMISAIDLAKEEVIRGYLMAPRPESAHQKKDKSFAYNNFDVFGFWLEDNNRFCLCEKCRTPIRLPNGKLVHPENSDFRGTQYFFNGTAVIQAINVHAARHMKLESIGYFWMSNPPLIEISRNYIVRFCPYFRKNYFEPIYAPCNDIWWRAMYRWGQVNVELSLYDYFLSVLLRPWATIAQYDIKAERDIGVSLVSHEGAAGDFAALDMMDRWITNRLFRDPDADVQQLRKYYIRRTFREAAPEMEKFFFLYQNFILEQFAPKHIMELEDNAWIGSFAARTKSPRAGQLHTDPWTVLDEADSHIEAAKKKIKNPASIPVFEKLYKHWKSYCKEAKSYAEQLDKQNGGPVFNTIIP